MLISSLDSSAAHARLDTYVVCRRGSCLGNALCFTGFQAVQRFLWLWRIHVIIDHVGWKSSWAALHYIKLKQVLNHAGPAARLADFKLQTDKNYKGGNNLSIFTPAFPHK